MSQQLVGHLVTRAAVLEAPSQRELEVFINHELNNVPDVIDPTDLLEMLNTNIKSKFGTSFTASWVDAQTGYPADESDETVMLLVDAYTMTTRLQ